MLIRASMLDDTVTSHVYSVLVLRMQCPKPAPPLGMTCSPWGGLLCGSVLSGTQRHLHQLLLKWCNLAECQDQLLWQLLCFVLEACLDIGSAAHALTVVSSPGVLYQTKLHVFRLQYGFEAQF